MGLFDFVSKRLDFHQRVLTPGGGDDPIQNAVSDFVEGDLGLDLPRLPNPARDLAVGAARLYNEIRGRGGREAADDGVQYVGHGWGNPTQGHRVYTPRQAPIFVLPDRYPGYPDQLPPAFPDQRSPIQRPIEPWVPAPKYQAWPPIAAPSGCGM